MNTYENVEIFEDTKRLCEKNEKLKASVAESVKNQKLILESEKLPVVDAEDAKDDADEEEAEEIQTSDTDADLAEEIVED